jgi:3'-phosphoadenosine 5'-phosphosulfate sulfotransferase (PAPS reductase)/FAD synthetase
VTAFYDFSGGMESAAMLWLERERIKDTGAIVRFADTGKQFPEAAASREQIATLAGIDIVTVPRRITFDEFLFERGGMLRRGMSDCSRRMKRANLSRHMRTFPRPYEVNLGFNFDEEQRADDFIALTTTRRRDRRSPSQEATSRSTTSHTHLAGEGQQERLRPPDHLGDRAVLPRR